LLHSQDTFFFLKSFVDLLNIIIGREDDLVSTLGGNIKAAWLASFGIV